MTTPNPPPAREALRRLNPAEYWEEVIGNIPEPQPGDPHGWEPYWEQLRNAIHAIQGEVIEAAAKECEDLMGLEAWATDADVTSEVAAAWDKACECSARGIRALRVTLK